jgi:hypothetical protein
MVSERTLEAFSKMKPPVHYIVGVRMRRTKEVGEVVLKSRVPWQEVTPERQHAKDPAPLKVKEVTVQGRRYIVCLNEEERRKALMSHFILGMPYILWANIPRGLQISCPHIERSCTAAYYSDRRLGVSEIARASAATIHLFNGNNIGAKGDLASRSLNIRLSADRADPENRAFTHPNPIDWTKNHRGDILAALYTILLGNPQLKAPRDAPAKTRFKMWWRLVGSAVENAAKLAGQELDFQKLFITQEEDDEESASLADVLDVLVKKWPEQFTASDVAGMINNPSPNEDEQTLREYLLPGALPNHVFSAKSIGKLLKRHLDEPVRSGERTLVLRSWEDKHVKQRVYGVCTIATT